MEIELDQTALSKQHQIEAGALQRMEIEIVDSQPAMPQNAG